MIRTAIRQGATAIAGFNRVPEAMGEAFKAVIDADILLGVDTAVGLDAVDSPGAMILVGSDERGTGLLANGSRVNFRKRWWSCITLGFG